MSHRMRKAWEILLVLFIMVLSVVIFLNRDKLGNVKNADYLGLLLLCFLANSTVLLPAPSLMIAASCATVMTPLPAALFGALGASLGEVVGYLFGAVSKELSPRLYAVMDRYLSKIKNPYLIVFVLAVLPLPLFDLIGIYSGGRRMNLPAFWGICFLGKFIKFAVYVNVFSAVAEKMAEVSF